MLSNNKTNAANSLVSVAFGNSNAQINYTNPLQNSIFITILKQLPTILTTLPFPRAVNK